MISSVWRLFTVMVLWAVSGTAGAVAHVLPEPFHGVWQNMEGRKAQCRRSDWNGANHSDTHIKVDTKVTEGMESHCRVKGVKQNPSGAVRLNLACASEGVDYVTDEIWSIADVQGHRLLIKTSVDKQTFHIQVYQYCPD